MGDLFDPTDLAEILPRVRSRISKYRGNRNFNEQNTKASLIVPILKTLGWDTNDPEEVHWEYKPKPKYNPVDSALLLQRTPCLLLEAKALRDNLRDDKLVAQIISYASASGVGWVVLTNGDEYRIYNASAPVPADEKFFRSVSVSKDDEEPVIRTLSLLSKPNLEDKKISRLWDSHFVDRQVGSAIEELLNSEAPAQVIVRAIRKLSGGTLRQTDIKASIRRARFQLDFPTEPEGVAPEKRKQRTRPARAKTQRGGKPSTSVQGISLLTLINEGILRPPTKLSSRFKGHELTATLNPDGSVSVGSTRYPSISAAAAIARKPYYRGTWKGEYPPTNGWTFWKVKDPTSGEVVQLHALRVRYLERKGEEAQRFLRRN